MTTWSSKRALAALALLAALGACEGGGTNTLLAGLSPPQDTALPAVPLTKALMMRGNVTLLPPRGYCIDPGTLSQSFALMARCDTLGAPTSGQGAPAGVMTVSFVRAGGDTSLPSALEVTSAAGLSAPSEERTSAASRVFKTTGSPPSSDLSPQHWRAIAQIGAFTMGAALFGPEGRRAVSAEGAEVLEEMIARTTQQTRAN